MTIADHATIVSSRCEVPNAPTGSLRNLAVLGSIWVGVGYSSSQLLRLASYLILTRLLMPDAFGLMVLVSVFLTALQMFSDVGIGHSIIQNRRGADPAFLNTAWTIQILRGVILWLLSFPLGWLAVELYGNAELMVLIPVAALTALVSGFDSTAIFTQNRQLALGRVTLLEVGTQLAVLVVMVSVAIVWPTVWALVIGSVAGACVRAILSHTAIPGIRHRLEWDHDSLRAFFGLGKWIFISTALTFGAQQLDKAIFGGLIPLDALGIYGIALVLAAVPAQVVLRLGSAVIFPLYSREGNGAGPTQGMFVSVRKVLLTTSGLMILVLVVSGPALVDVVFDERYADAGWMLQVLGVGTWFLVLECCSGAALLAAGQARYVAANNVGKVVGIAVLVPLGFYLYGFSGALVGVVVAEALKYGVSVLGIRRIGLTCIKCDVIFTLILGLLIAASGPVLSARP